ncbi:Protein of unknown function [Micromonospora phaseoli]|uniref:DUF998 domain-containing protein n=1 Tax=Micromonospora phaseoli TaxID=1144548 RepID=A0A1H7BTU3_9ACTN|nr:DUF998 domain-containing protein [Micromonospora phaseoli]PZV92836.1 uncharacterized protein DUF998 [Micromonospora phaseoli]GIJ76508.1 hypothetical protein Xph01_09400 [Micromonospora phaseoli]SEJ80989.1 Protein of unknown function [Micromonospora phaseoli]
MVFWAGAVGAALFVLVFLVDGWRRPNYSPVRHPVSALALGRRGWVQTANFLVSGSAITAGALAMVFVGPSALTGVVLTAFGLGLVASGVFRMDPMLGYPQGAPAGIPERHSTPHRLHDLAGAVVFLALPLAAAIGAFTLPGTAWKIISGCAAVALFVGLGRFSRAWEEVSPRLGLIQRAVIILGWGWLAALFSALALGLS